MQIPDRVPGLKWLVIFWAVAAVIWSVLEGDFERVRLFGFLTTLTSLGYLFQRFMAGRTFSAVGGLLTMGLWGLALGVGTTLMTLFMMVLKTGLHAHGPEFSMAEITAVWEQIPLWSLVGLLIGLGAGLLLIARTDKD
jgi:hypothetical protein